MNIDNLKTSLILDCMGQSIPKPLVQNLFKKERPVIDAEVTLFSVVWDIFLFFTEFTIETLQ